MVAKQAGKGQVQFSDSVAEVLVENTSATVCNAITHYKVKASASEAGQRYRYIDVYGRMAVINHDRLRVGVRAFGP